MRKVLPALALGAVMAISCGPAFAITVGTPPDPPSYTLSVNGTPDYNWTADSSSTITFDATDSVDYFYITADGGPNGNFTVTVTSGPSLVGDEFNITTPGGLVFSQGTYVLDVTLASVVAGAADPPYITGDYNAPPIGDLPPINATPLPASWTMLLIGLAGFGFFSCRGRKKGLAATAAT
jgi:hypothetical protein